MTRAGLVIGVAALAILCVACTRDLGSLGGTFGVAADINDGGTVVGYSVAASGKGHAFIEAPAGVITDLGTGTRAESTAHAINDAGVVVGSTANGSGSSRLQVPFVWTAATGLVELALPPGTTSAWAADINDAGTIVVNSGKHAADYHAWIYDTTSATYTPLGTLGHGYEQAAAIAADGKVVGTALTATGTYHAVGWLSASHAIVDFDAGLPGSSQATGINATGTVVGWSNDYTDAVAYSWSGGVRTTIGLGRPAAINDAGVVVGTGITGGGAVRAAHLWDPVHAVSKDLDGLDPAPLADEATAINDLGVTVGSGTNGAGESRPLIFDPYVAP